MKFTKSTIEICGKEYKWKRCTTSQILEHQKNIEKEQDKYQDVIDKSNTLQRDIEDIDKQIERIEKYSEAINKEEFPSDEDLGKVAELNLNLIELDKQRRKLVEKSEKLDKKHKEDIRNLSYYILEQYGELASLQIEGLTKEEYVQNATESDQTIVRLLASIKKMLALGSSSKEVEKFVKKNVNEEASQSFREQRRNK